MERRESNDRSNRAPSSVLLVLGALAVGSVLATSLVKMTRKKKGERRHVETVRDKSLKDTFPASDPPASQFFDIPVNRR